jgi:nucleotide-binding universal stress UspA family protein
MGRFQTILVPLDFSAHAQAALALAIDLARQAPGARLHLLHVFELRIPLSPPYERISPDAYLDGLREVATSRLAEAERAAAEAGVAYETHFVQGMAADVVPETARRVGADVIVMGTRGLTGLKHALLGSVAEQTARVAPCPVLTLHAPAGPARRAALPFRRILVPVDFSPHADAALALAIELGREHGAELHVLHVNELPVLITTTYGIAIPQSVWDEVREAASAGLERALEEIRAAGLTGHTHLVTGPAADSIVAAAESAEADLVVMGTRGLRGLKHALLGSVAERTLRTAACPVLTVRAGP